MYLMNIWASPQFFAIVNDAAINTIGCMQESLAYIHTAMELLGDWLYRHSTLLGNANCSPR